MYIKCLALQAGSSIGFHAEVNSVLYKSNQSHKVGHTPSYSLLESFLFAILSIHLRPLFQ